MILIRYQNQAIQEAIGEIEDLKDLAFTAPELINMEPHKGETDVTKVL
jgi:hypothetical protein